MPRDCQIVVFDLDGTILASTPFYFAILEKIFAGHGIELSADEKVLASGLSAKSFLSSRLDALAVENALEFMAEQSARDLDHIPVFSGMSEVLSDLKKRGRQLAVWTSRDRVSANALLEKNKLHVFFDLVLAADCVEKHKPDPEGLLTIAKRLGRTPENVLMIGDHDVDMMAARSAGAKAIRANWHGLRLGESCRYGEFTAHCIGDLRLHLS